MTWEINSRITEIRKNLGLSQTEFGKNIGVSRGVIKNIDDNKVVAKPLLIQQICKTYNVNSTWLETGEGEMFNELSRDEQIARFIGETLGAEDDTFQKRLISALSKMSVEEWEALEGLINRLAESTKKESE
jgi:HTH-type transcriptional regulator / antitoxin PezA